MGVANAASLHADALEILGFVEKPSTCSRQAPGRAPLIASDARPGTHTPVRRLVGVMGAIAFATISDSPSRRDFGTDHGVAAFDLVRERLADVVHQRRAARRLLVEPQLGRHHPCQKLASTACSHWFCV
jgi:hypothetical protein